MFLSYSHADRLSKLEQTLSTMKSSIVTTLSIISGILAEQRRINSVLNQQESTIYKLNQEVQVSCLRAETMESSVENRMGESEERRKDK